ncbi:hypothetical protein KSP40_PGU017777 [Platanthera guangdongensis]|uniref:Uncharacterized protein n=1 Tax=Platanthera guangdongensis TaxID=2320717 RepID=A0ABR2LZ42_9ASPA
MADQKKNSFDLQEKISPAKEPAQPPKVTEKGSVFNEASSLTGPSSSHSSTSKILEALSKPVGSHHEPWVLNMQHKKDKDDESENTSWWLGGGGVFYGGRD